jgi:hypothetical protein
MRSCVQLVCFLAACSLLPVLVRPQAPLLPASSPPDTLQSSPEGPIQLSPVELAIYRQAQPVIDWTPRQVHDCPYLHGLKPSINQDQLSVVLERTGQTVALMFHNFRDVSCDEKIYSDEFGWRGAAPDSRGSRQFHYIIVRRSLGELPAFVEYRTDRKGNSVDLTAAEPSRRSFPMITGDFTSTFLFFSPEDQRGDLYRYLGVQSLRYRKCNVVGFAQEPQNVRRPSFLFVGDQKDVVLVQGLAWIDARTFQILRIMTWLLAPRTDIGLDKQITTVDFFPVRPRETDKVLWMPHDVTVEALYRGVKTRNLHQYSNFKLFRVESTIKPGP